MIKDLEQFEETHVKESYKNLEFFIVLVQPENAGNIGSIARIMKNFEFKNLVIFNPIEPSEKILSYKTQGYAMHGKDVLLNAEIHEDILQKNHIDEFENYMTQFDYIIGTTAKGTHYSNIKRIAIFPENLRLPKSEKPLKVAILFGKESRGLTNEEVALCDVLIRIPTGNEYPTLNLSHACGILLYNIFKKTHNIEIGRGVHPVLIADKEDKQLLYDFIQNIIQMLKIRTHKKENVLYAFKNIFERAIVSKKELSLIIGVFSKLNNILENLDLYSKK